MTTPDQSQLTAIIPSLGRTKCLRRLQKSLKAFAPNARVLVAYQSSQPPAKGANVVQLPPGVGRAAACNALLARVRTRYFLLVGECDQLHRESRLTALLNLVESDRLDLAGGTIVGCRRRMMFFVSRKPEVEHGLLDFAGDRLVVSTGTRSSGEGFQWCDYVSNFFVARTDKVRSLGGWDTELHSDERIELFARAQRRGLRVGYAAEASIWHWHEKPIDSPIPHYDLRSLAVAKMGCTSMTDRDGLVIKAPRRAVAA